MTTTAVSTLQCVELIVLSEKTSPNPKTTSSSCIITPSRKLYNWYLFSLAHNLIYSPVPSPFTAACRVVSVTTVALPLPLPLQQ